MTTPERLKKRQRIIEFTTGMYFFAVSIGVGVFVWDGEQKDAKREAAAAEQRQATAAVVECITDNFTDLAAALEARGKLTQRESDAVRKVLRTAAEVNGGSDAAVTRALDEYLIEQAKISDARERNPLPPFPSGECDRAR